VAEGSHTGDAGTGTSCTEVVEAHPANRLTIDTSTAAVRLQQKFVTEAPC